MKLYYSDVLSPHKACAVARYLKSPVEFVKGEQQAPAYLVLNPNEPHQPYQSTIFKH